MKILIYLPVYNDEYRIERAVKSVLFQKYKNWELIISDNKSTDGTLNKLRTYSTDERIICIGLEKHETSAANFNNVEQFLRNDLSYQLVCFLASDDYWGDENYLENLVNSFVANKAARLVVPVFTSISHIAATPDRQILIKARHRFYPARIIKLLNCWGTVHLLYGLYEREFFLKILTNKFSKLDDKNKGTDWWWTYFVLKNTIPVLCSNSYYFKDTYKEDSFERISRINNLKLTFRFIPDFFRGKLSLISFNNFNDFLLIFIFAISKTTLDLLHTFRRTLKRVLKV